jgi:multidrug efflux pump
LPAHLPGAAGRRRASRFDAAVEAASVRLRPIIMTSFAFVLGVLPLVIAQGAGAEMRRTLGTAVFAGLIGMTPFGIFLTPVFYYVVRWFGDRVQPSQCRHTVRFRIGIII